jgi:hypothetical protein
MASLAQMLEGGFLSMWGQTTASRLDALAPWVLRSFGYYEIMGIKELHNLLSRYPRRRLETWVTNLRGVESSLSRRKNIQEQILIGAKRGCERLRSVELVDNNFTLAAYHFLARADSTWRQDDKFRVLELGPLGLWGPTVWCPVCDYNLKLQKWDTRSFTCPGHDVPLIPKEDALPIGVGFTHEIQKRMYQESVTTIEDIVVEHSSKAVLSMHIPKMLPFSELVIAVGELDSIPKLKHFVQHFLQTSLLREEVRQNEERLQRSYMKLLETLSSTLTVDAGQSNGGEGPAST